MPYVKSLTEEQPEAAGERIRISTTGSSPGVIPSLVKVSDPNPHGVAGRPYIMYKPGGQT